MPGTEHHTEGRTSRNGDSNVVPIRPRQWLDPDADLVPIATQEPIADADRTEAASSTPSPGATDDNGHASSWLGPGEQTVPITPSVRAASDFWGEDAADLLLAVEAPPPAALEPASEAEPCGPGRGRFTAPRLSIPKQVRSPRLLVSTALAAAIVVALAIASLGPAGKSPPHTAPIQAALGARAASSATSHARSTVTKPSERATPSAHHPARSRVRSHATMPESHIRAHHQHHRTTVRAATAHTAAATSASAPPPTTTSPPAPAPSLSSPSGAGPTGTVSLIGAGTSQSG